VVQEGDLVHVLLREVDAPRVAEILSAPPVER